ncbi:unnamed protein product [Ostreobium quekettii]|uniref:Uncharacterized protein n=1 Tax=Ostreobium quekettii TaxID=121088 RepID=A0A8S1IQR4_9CHLO|nr:unnamed protein product [Ostreobium quekettii]
MRMQHRIVLCCADALNALCNDDAFPAAVCEGLAGVSGVGLWQPAGNHHNISCTESTSMEGQQGENSHGGSSQECEMLQDWECLFPQILDMVKEHIVGDDRNVFLRRARRVNCQWCQWATPFITSLDLTANGNFKNRVKRLRGCFSAVESISIEGATSADFQLLVGSFCLKHLKVHFCPGNGVHRAMVWWQ